MATTFNHCPNCGREPWGALFKGSFEVYECKGKNGKCGTHYCDRCGGDRCPSCGGKERRKAGNAVER